MSSSNEEYLQTQMAIYNLASLVSDLDLSEFLRRIRLAETMGIYGMAPMEYQKNIKALQHIRDLAVSLVPFQKEARKQKKMAEEQRAKLFSVETITYVRQQILDILSQRDHLSLADIQASSTYAPSLVEITVKEMTNAGLIRQVEDTADHDWVYALVGGVA